MSDTEQTILETPLEKIERERLTRRQALRKFGFGAGLSAFLLLGVDDLARIVGARLEQMAGDNKIANQIAQEFQSAGIALATPPGGGLPGGCSAHASGATKDACCTPENVSKWCEGYSSDSQCHQCCSGVYGSDGTGFCTGYSNGSNDYRGLCWSYCDEHTF